MFSFRKKKEEVEEDSGFEEKIPRTKIKDLSPRNKKRRKEPIKIWTKKERIFVSLVLTFTLVISFSLTLSSKGTLVAFHLPKITLPTLTKTVVIKKDEKAKVEAISTVSPTTAKNKEDLIRNIQSLTLNLNGNYNIWVEEIGGKKLIYGINEDKPTEGASLFKLPLMIAVYRRIESGKVNKDNVSDALNHLAKNSDNNAFVTLSNIVGYPAINKAIQDAQMQNTSINDSVTSPHDIGNLYRNMMEGNLVSQNSKNEILDLLTNTSFEFLIPKGIPDVRVAHKYATTTGVLNDGGIVFTQNPFILVIMTEGVDIDEATETIPQIAKLVYNFEKDTN